MSGCAGCRWETAREPTWRCGSGGTPAGSAAYGSRCTRTAWYHLADIRRLPTTWRSRHTSADASRTSNSQTRLAAARAQVGGGCGTWPGGRGPGCRRARSRWRPSANRWARWCCRSTNASCGGDGGSGRPGCWMVCCWARRFWGGWSASGAPGGDGRRYCRKAFGLCVGTFLSL